MSARIDVLAVWRAAKRDKRLQKDDRIVLAHIARTGHVASPKAIQASCGVKNAEPILTRLRNAGYLPGGTA